MFFFVKNNKLKNSLRLTSASPGRVKKIMYKGKSAYRKKSSYTEYENLLRFAKILEKPCKIEINKKEYVLEIPEVYKWINKKSILITAEAKGDNLELMLRSMDTRPFAIKIYNTLLLLLLNNCLYWRDFAPRNVIVGESVIYFIDFEDGVVLDNSISRKQYLRDKVYSEYCNYLFDDEKIITIDEVYTIVEFEKNAIIDTNALLSGQAKFFLKVFKLKGKISIEVYLDLLRRISCLCEPICVCKLNKETNSMQQEIFFPITSYDKVKGMVKVFKIKKLYRFLKPFINR